MSVAMCACVAVVIVHGRSQLQGSQRMLRMLVPGLHLLLNPVIHAAYAVSTGLNIVLMFVA